MRVVDVNVLVHAARQDTLDSDAYAEWLNRARLEAEPLGIPSTVVSGLVRVITNPRVFVEPSTPEEAWSFVHDLLDAPNTQVVEPGPGHLGIFEELCTSIGARGNLVTDAYLAAVVMEIGATLFSADRDFAKFRDLRWRHPLDG